MKAMIHCQPLQYSQPLQSSGECFQSLFSLLKAARDGHQDFQNLLKQAIEVKNQICLQSHTNSTPSNTYTPLKTFEAQQLKF